MRRNVWPAALLSLSCCGGGGGALVVSEQQCQGYEDAASSRSVTFRVTNARAEALHFDETCSVPYEIVVNGTAHAPELGPTGTSCERAQAGHVFCCDCLVEATELAPGASVERMWGGLFFERRDMPEECVPDDAPPYPGCRQAVAPLDGPMTVVVHLFASVDCEVGGCFLSDPVEVSKDFVLGTDTVVELTAD